MVTVDLITGFLGAGKTTFIHKYMHFLKQKGLKIHLIENEFGSVSVDSLLLKDEADDHCDISDLSGLCMCCVGKEAFLNLLSGSARDGCDRILVEPSGIYDVDEFFDVLSNERLSGLCRIGSILTIVDPLSIDHLTEEAKYLMFSQMLSSGNVIVSKSQLTTKKELDRSLTWMDDLMKEKGCSGGVPAEIITKPWDAFTDQDFEDFMNAGYSRYVHDREYFSHSDTFQSLQLAVKADTLEEIKNLVQSLFENPSYGCVFRFKGLAKDTAKQWYEINCTGSLISIEPTSARHGICVVIGQRLNEKEIYRHFKLKFGQD